MASDHASRGVLVFIIAAVCCGAAALLVGAGVLATGASVLDSPELTVAAVVLAVAGLWRLTVAVRRKRS